MICLSVCLSVCLRSTGRATFLILSLLTTTFLSSNGQEAKNCEDIPTFIGIPEETLCEQYGGGVYDLTLNSPTLNSASKLLAFLLGNTASGKIYIADDFYVDIDFHFDNCTLEIAPGKQIFVTGGPAPLMSGQYYGDGAKLYIKNSKVFACGELWKGIRLVKTGSQANITNSEVEDAEIGIDAPVSSAIGLKNAIFNRNRIGVSLGREAGSITLDNAPAFSTFSGNLFSCTAPLNGTTDEISQAGIRILRCPAAIHSEAVSKFTDSRFGIQVPGYNDYITTLSISNCDFEEVGQYGVNVVRGALTVKFCLFKNWGDRGIYAQCIYYMIIYSEAGVIASEKLVIHR